MKISSVRLGHANNSSSTHSILLNSTAPENKCAQDFQYGWEWFHLKNRNDKAKYLAALIYTVLREDMAPEHAAIVTRDLTGMDPRPANEDDGDADKNFYAYVDHQSVNVFPLEFGKNYYDPMFMREFVKYIRDNDAISIQGGNDNDDQDAHRIDGERLDINNLPRDYGKIPLFGRKDGDWWTLYNRNSGAKIRVSFAQNPDAYIKATRPELVDVKITDFCPFGCSFCLTPETKVLYSDMTWRPIGEAKVGDVLVGFDEMTSNNYKRKYRKSSIQAISRSKKPVYMIKTPRRSIFATGNHGWLVYRTSASGHKVWYSTDQLKPSKHALAFVFNPVSVEESRDYKAGYIAGMTMGDGTFNYKPEYIDKSRSELGGMQLWWRVAVTDFEIIERLNAYLKVFGVEAVIGDFYEGTEMHRSVKKIETRKKAFLEVIHSIVYSPKETEDYKRGFVAGFYDAEGNDGDSLRIAQKKDISKLELFVRYAKDIGFSFDLEDYGGDGCLTARMIGDVEDRMRFYAVVRPAISRKMTYWDGCETSMTPEEIISVESVGEMDVVDIQTSTATFVAEGIATHNCYQDSTKQGKHADTLIIEKIADACGNAKVFEVAIGGGEPTMHPDFVLILQMFNRAGVTPNFTSFSMKWAKDEDIVSAVNKYCRSFAISSISEVKELAIWNNNVKDKGVKGTLQIPLGCYSKEATIKALIQARMLNVPVTLLGYKHFGRGKTFNPKDFSWIIDFLCARENEYEKFGADSVFVEQFGEVLKKSGVSEKLMVSREGAFSCYIDAVSKKMGASSYTNELHDIPDDSDIFQKFPYAA